MFGARAGAERLAGDAKQFMCDTLATSFEEQQEGAAVQVRRNNHVAMDCITKPCCWCICVRYCDATIAPLEQYTTNNTFRIEQELWKRYSCRSEDASSLYGRITSAASHVLLYEDPQTQLEALKV